MDSQLGGTAFTLLPPQVHNLFTVNTIKYIKKTNPFTPTTGRAHNNTYMNRLLTMRNVQNLQLYHGLYNSKYALFVESSLLLPGALQILLLPEGLLDKTPKLVCHLLGCCKHTPSRSAVFREILQFRAADYFG